MARQFNVYGPINKDKHYYVPRQELLDDIMAHIIQGEYFTIYAPRQSGKTTLREELDNALLAQPEFTPIPLDFQLYEQWTVDSFLTSFGKSLCRYIKAAIPSSVDPPPEPTGNIDWSVVRGLLQRPPSDYETLKEFFIDLYGVWPTAKLVLIIDEFDSTPQDAITQLLLIWRFLYLERRIEHSLHSVILIGLANLARINLGRSSPFNIARQVELPRFRFQEVKGLLNQYARETGQKFEPDAIKKLCDVTSGQPFLVNRMAIILTKELVTDRSHVITENHVRQAYRQFTTETNYNFETILRRAGEYPDEVFQILFGRPYEFNQNNKIVKALFEDGVISPTERGQCQISNTIYRQVLLAGFVPVENSLQADMLLNGYNLNPDIGLSPDTIFQMKTLLSRFREFVERRGFKAFEISPTPQEATGQYLLMAYLASISDRVDASVFSEVPTGNGRMDIVFVYGQKRYVIETKIWRGESLYEDGLEQLQGYMVCEGVTTGYYVVFHNRPNVYGEFTQADLEYTETRNGFTIHVYFARLGDIFGV